MTKNLKYDFQINPSSGVPVYRQIMDQVKTMIALGRLASGIFMPSVRQMAQELEINPMTVSKAYSLLEKESVLEHVRGQGMKVISGPEAKKFLNDNRQAISPLLSEVVQRAKQLSLDLKEIHHLIDDAWRQ